MAQFQLRQFPPLRFHSGRGHGFNLLASLHHRALCLCAPASLSGVRLASKMPTGAARSQPPSGTVRPRMVCKISGPDLTSQLELSEPEEKRRKEKRANGIYWIILLNLGIYLADHVFMVRSIQSLYLNHSWPAWYQFVTATFCHASWCSAQSDESVASVPSPEVSNLRNHLSSNLFFVYIFGKLVEEEEGSTGLWLSYIFTGFGANLVSWLVLPRNAVSVGASGAVFGLFAISVLVKMSLDWRKILEVLILGQFVIEKVMDAARASAVSSATIYGCYSLQTVNHIAHLSGALVGIVLVWVLTRLPSGRGNEAHSYKRKLP